MIQRLRVPLGFGIAAVVLYIATPTPASMLVGCPIALLGAVFRALAAGVIKKNTQLATSGIYSMTRNPLYFGSTLLAAGFAIMSSNQAAAFLLLIPSILIYPRVIVREEEHLAGVFREEFPLYKAKVPRFFPRPTLGFSLSFSLKQYFANREYNTALGLGAAVAILYLKMRTG
jgi:protein-S-isoprenylcysteine O-methyltransferase Ste14